MTTTPYNHNTDTIVTLTEHLGADMESRYYCDDTRISRETYDTMRERSTRMDCFFSTAKQTGTLIRRTNYVNVWLPIEVMRSLTGQMETDRDGYTHA